MKINLGKYDQLVTRAKEIEECSNKDYDDIVNGNSKTVTVEEAALEFYKEEMARILHFVREVQVYTLLDDQEESPIDLELFDNIWNTVAENIRKVESFTPRVKKISKLTN